MLVKILSDLTKQREERLSEIWNFETQRSPIIYNLNSFKSWTQDPSDPEADDIPRCNNAYLDFQLKMKGNNLIWTQFFINLLA